MLIESHSLVYSIVLIPVLPCEDVNGYHAILLYARLNPHPRNQPAEGRVRRRKDSVLAAHADVARVDLVVQCLELLDRLQRRRLHQGVSAPFQDEGSAGRLRAAQGLQAGGFEIRGPELEHFGGPTHEAPRHVRPRQDDVRLVHPQDGESCCACW